WNKVRPQVWSKDLQTQFFGMFLFGIMKFQKDIRIPLSRTVFDSKYKMQREFLQEARNHLQPNGRILIGFSRTIGDWSKLEANIQEASLECKTLAQEFIPEANGSLGMDMELIEARPK